MNCLGGSSTVCYRGLSFDYRIHWWSDCPYGLYLHYIYIYISYIRIYRSRSCHHADCWTCGFAKQVSLLAFETTDVSWALAHLGLNWVNFSVQDLIAAALKRRLSCWCSGPERGGPAEGQILARLSVKALQCQCVCDKIPRGVSTSTFAAGTSVHDLWMIYGYHWISINGMWKCSSILRIPGIASFQGRKVQRCVASQEAPKHKSKVPDQGVELSWIFQN